MVFRDTRLTCEACGNPFFFTVTEQRQLAEEQGEEAVVPPELCPQCRSSAQQAVDLEMPTQPAAAKPAEPPPRPQAPPEPERKRREEQEPEPQETEETFEDFPLEVEGVEIKLIGRVKWYSREKGYGFVTTASNQDIFFHRANIVDRRLRLREDDRVEFQVRQTKKGPEAFNVSLLPAE
jgi:CspA family cold shock protein